MWSTKCLEQCEQCEAVRACVYANELGGEKMHGSGGEKVHGSGGEMVYRTAL